ncbi:MAG TPA: hypothetical protein PKE31_13410 [Pseudomonadota bacterium]|nr:hypothetical protein [Pseudomonadota bacterium]
MRTWILCFSLLLSAPVHVANAESHADPHHKERALQLARSLSQEATQAFERRDYARTQTLLEAAYMLFPSEKFQFSLGRTYEATGQKLLAMRAFQQFLRKVPLHDRSPGQTEDATYAIGKLKRDLGHLLFSQPLPAPAQIDDEASVPAGSHDAWVEPGTHRLVLPQDIEQVTIGPGETRTIRVTGETSMAITSADVVVEPKAPPAQRRGLGPAKWTLGTLGVLSLATGGVLVGIHGLRACSDFPTACREPLATQWPGVGLLAGGGTLLGVSIVLFAVDRKR